MLFGEHRRCFLPLFSRPIKVKCGHCENSAGQAGTPTHNDSGLFVSTPYGKSVLIDVITSEFDCASVCVACAAAGRQK